MEISQILMPSRTFTELRCFSKKRCLERISELIAEPFDSLDSQTLFTALINREKLGSTGLGNGIAIPHCQLADCNQVVGALFRLEQAIDYDAIDKTRVDLLFVLLVPSNAANEHLQVLSKLAENFSRLDYRQSLREAKDNRQLYHAAVAD
jgi:PTS system nitrogen regulatory IIA component